MRTSAGTVHHVVLLGAVLAVAAAVVVAASGRLPAAQAKVSPGLTQRASVADDGSQLGRGGGQPAISADGRYVAFATNTAIDPVDAMNDVPAGPEQVGHDDSDVYIRDLVTRRTTLITAGYAAPPVDGGSDRPRVPADGDSIHPSISADGRFIAFHTTARNLTGGHSGTYSREVVVCDRGPGFDARPVPPGPAPCQFTEIDSGFPHADFSDSQPSLAADAGAVAWVAGGPGNVVVTPWHRAPANRPGSGRSDPASLASPSGGRASRGSPVTAAGSW